MSKALPYQYHLFICTNHKEKGENCAAKGMGTTQRKLKEHLKSRFPNRKDFRINSSGCLGQCEKGGVAVLYPQCEWLFGLNQENEASLFKRLEELLCDELDQNTSPKTTAGTSED